MERSRFEQFEAQVIAASAGQILELEDVIQRVISRQFTDIALARRTRETVRARLCPHCRHNNVVLHGKDRNRRQRFKCRDCRRTYNILTGTPMARARKPEKWENYLGCMTEHMSVRKIVASGLGVHAVTAWRWRHRFLQAAVSDNAAVLSGVVEAGETFFPWSFKGRRGWKPGGPPEDRTARRRGWGAARHAGPHRLVPVLSAVDNSGNVFDAILASLSGIEAALAGRIAAGSVLCSGGVASYVAAADNANSEHVAVSVAVTLPPAGMRQAASAPARTTGRLGLGRVNNHHRGLKHLIDERCRGVATKYLGNYLAWHRAMSRPGFTGRGLLVKALG